MNNFVYYNPVKIVFGKGTIAELASLLPENSKILLLYGGGSIKKNGVYDQVVSALDDFEWFEFSGIEPNPHYETLMKAVELVKEKEIDFLLSVGGGSVLDGTKFIAAAALFEGDDPWQIIKQRLPLEKALPLGAVLTLPATGSEMNGNMVVSKVETNEKRATTSTLVMPKFSILDPETTFTLPRQQTENGIVDAFVHVVEQYLTTSIDTPLQDRQAEAILNTLIEEAPKVLEHPEDYNARANVMWCATVALNTSLTLGVQQDWATHMIGHEITAAYGLDHAQSLAVVLPGVLKYQRDKKRTKLVQFGERVFNIKEGPDDERAEQAIEETEKFFKSVGMKTRLSDWDIPTDAPAVIGKRIEENGMVLGEHGDICRQQVEEILKLRV